MKVDLDHLEGMDPIDADLCIVGSGAAGIALACELADSDLRIVLVESGAADRGQRASILNEGETEGFPFVGLAEGRVRAFGGATLRWAGQCIRLDPIDFEKRDWVPFSGWPIDFADFSHAYDRAERFLDLPSPRYDADVWRSFGISVPEFSSGVSPKFTVYCREPDFAKAFGPRLKTKGVRILLNATATEIVPAAGGGRIRHVALRSLSGRKARLTARWFVLAAGGIENPRLLLASRSVVPGGVGNACDLVGRFLQDHPSGRTAVVRTQDPRPLQALFAKLQRNGIRYWPKLAVDAATQRSDEILNGNAYPVYDYEGPGPAAALHRLRDAAKLGRIRRSTVGDVLRTSGAAPLLLREWLSARRARREPVFPPSKIWIQAFTEQAPDPANRIALSGETDALGMPKARISWRLGELERRTLEVVTERVGSELSRLGLGEAVLEEWVRGTPDLLSGNVQDAFHHAGTTRMSEAPSGGVVDPWCQVHGIENLFVAGGSVMPTSGYANPTLTIVALALRTADEIRRRQRREQGTAPSVGGRSAPPARSAERA